MRRYATSPETATRGDRVVRDLVGIAVMLVMAAGLTGLMILLSSKLGKKHPTFEKLEPFECGKRPFSLPSGRLSVSFYLTAILFILFDVEVVFLYPWAVLYRGLGWVGLVEMAIFLGVLVIGFIYAWDNDALEWR